jgi:hypothetical protein
MKKHDDDQKQKRVQALKVLYFRGESSAPDFVVTSGSTLGVDIATARRSFDTTCRLSAL